MNERALSENTKPAPNHAEANAATVNPPRAGPSALARLNPALFRAIATGNCPRGTNSGTIACQVGPFIAAPALSKQVRTSNEPGPIQPARVNPLSSTAATNIQPDQQSSKRRRSNISAIAPASKPNNSTG